MRKPDISVKKKAGFRDYLSFFKKIPPIIRLVWDASPWLCTTAFATAFLTSFNPLVQAFISKLIIDEVVSIVKTNTGYQEALSRISGLLMIAFIIACLKSLLGRVRNASEILLRDKFLLHLNMVLFEKVSRLNIRFFEDPAF
ncbi:hypothetical protein L6258_00600, partial [Candidatus Parcubacteria bacterium]|nr:hypothetical protein [Candidatus Parcubacteria bacterium]